MTYKKILIDIDGVLADFVGGCCKVHGRPNPYDEGFTGYQIEDAWNISADEFWAPTGTVEFWSTLEKFPWADRLVHGCVDMAGEPNVAFCSAPSTRHTAECIAGKTEWLDRYYPGMKRIFTKHKEFCASPDTILIDDTDEKLDKFKAHGGVAIRVPQPWNRGLIYPDLGAILDEVYLELRQR